MSDQIAREPEARQRGRAKALSHGDDSRGVQEIAMKTYSFQITAHVLLIVLVGVGAAFGQDVGEIVNATTAVELKVEDTVVASVAAGDALTVRKVADKWLWVQTADGHRGWVLKDQVSVTAAPQPRAEAPSPSAAPTTSQPRAANDPWLTAIGVLSGQNIYTTYAYIGAVADGYGNESYTAVQVQQLMKEVATMANVTREHLQRVRDTNIVDQDRAVIDEVITIIELLTKEANALSRYAKSGADADLQAYDKARTEVWPKVRTMLDLK